MAVNTSKLTPKQVKALAVLVDGGADADAARAAGVTARTVRRYRTLPNFVAALHKAEGRALRDMSRKLTHASRSALAVIERIMEDTSEPSTIRLRAAGMLLQHRATFYELGTLTDRVTALEEKQPQ